VNDFRWMLLDWLGREMRATQSFSQQADAEAWMSDHWEELDAEGAKAVRLDRGQDAVYTMNLTPA
jgi:hypothetical protein